MQDESDQKHGNHDHNEHHRMMIRDFRRRFILSVIITIPILLLSPMIQDWFGLEWEFQGQMIVLFGLSSFLFVYGGWPFLKGLFSELRQKNPGMMTLIAVAICAVNAQLLRRKLKT